MKILVYNVREDEEPEINSWAEKNHVDVKIIYKELNVQTAELAEGYDGIAVQQLNSLKDPRIYEKLSSYGIKQMAFRTTGYEIANLQAANENGISITNVPAYSPRSVSELVLAQVMYLVRHLGLIENRLEHNNFKWFGLQANEIHNLTIGIVGAGKIGSAVARIFKALGAKVIATDPVFRPELCDTLEYVDYDTLYKTADVVTMHTPLKSDTEHMIDAKVFKMMKPSAFFINDSRGGVVATEDLIAALTNKEIAGAAIDTIENEAGIFNTDLGNSKPNNAFLNELMNMPNVKVTPHTGFYTDAAVKNMVDIALDETLRVLKGEQPLNKVN
ncbi:D-2-hydroxyacid dehydrogenase [Apilactobacillus xinyiensis]|uniref:D-2-hydroxyacid dehydrogenase n=1 Tax=Apilactobacillus xinyiensis TaxID=2841032 RepID=UPI001C7E15AF|nr:D-2-hydroxyacid dehydrogenase [Apilactobacillus xinyiensis]